MMDLSYKILDGDYYNFMFWIKSGPQSIGRLAHNTFALNSVPLQGSLGMNSIAHFLKALQ